MFFLTAGFGHAQQPKQLSLAWDCWVSSGSPTAISCIRDRGGELPHPSDQAEENLEELLLDHIHYRMHSGDTEGADKLIRDNIKVFRRDSIWQITTNIPPYESSWDEGRPQLLVRAFLCPGHLPCTVTFKRPPPEPATAQKQPARKRKR